MGNKYTTSDISVTLGVSLRTAQRYVDNLVVRDAKGHLTIPEDVYNLIIRRHLGDIEVTDYEIVEGFTAEEYQEFKKRLTEYPMLKEKVSLLLKELDYHRTSAESHNRQMEIILQSLQQRNYIEAKRLLDNE